MRFMMLVKHAEKQGPPPPKEFMDAMAIIHEEAVKAGTIRGSGGLAPTAQSTHVSPDADPAIRCNPPPRSAPATAACAGR